MSDDGDKVCPLCAEDMDLTDQQLKPCKCGYEICVWCWHHIVEMAEKEATDGRCPACRTPYDKDRIVGMAANCERLMSGMNSEKRHKPQKVKPKPSAETRKQLSTVRVIQRSLVYIIGLPANLCDESLLESKEYFGQYGNVLKVSISRPASTTNQQASNSNTFSVYINYAKEEEAIRCIQSVHNFILDGKPLRASFGTTKYCHAWLRNMTCSNPDCLYLHDIGIQEDSFTKDEIISAYSRKVPKISSNSSQRRTGSILPPPVDELTSNGSSTSKHSLKNASNQNTIGQAKVSNGSLGRHNVLPAAASWGLRPSNEQSCSQSSLKQNFDNNRSSSPFSSISTGIKETSSSWNDDAHIPELQLPKEDAIRDYQSTMTDSADFSFQAGTCHPRVSAWDDEPVPASNLIEKSYDSQAIGSSKMMSPPRFSFLETKIQAAGIDFPSDVATVEINHTTYCPSSSDASVPEEDKAGVFSATWEKRNAVNENSVETFGNHSVDFETTGLTPNHTYANQDIQNASSVLSFVNIENNSEQPKTSLPYSSFNGLPKNPADKSQLLGEDLKKSISVPSHVVHTFPNAQAFRKSGGHLESELQDCQPTENRMEPPLDFSDMRQRLSDVSNQRSSSPQLDHSFSKSNSEPSCTVNGPAHSLPCGELVGHTNQHTGLQSIRQTVHKLDSEQYEDKLSNINKPDSSLYSRFLSSNENLVHIDRFNGIEKAEKCSSVQTQESSIISDIFSLDFDPWDDSLSIENNFSKLLGEKNGKEGSGMLISSLNAQNSSQSRFSFARQENQDTFIGSSISAIGYTGKGSSVKASYGDAFQDDFTELVSLGNGTTKNNVTIASDRPVGLLRAKVSAPPGFSLPSRPAPPGFAVQDRHEKIFETAPDIRLVQNSLVRNHHQQHPTEHSGDIELIDPAILAVGKGLIPIGNGNPTYGLGSSFPAQFSSSECDHRLQLLMQQSVSSHQTMKFPDHIRDNFFPDSDSYTASHLLAQNQSILSPLAQLSHPQSRSSHVSSDHWDGLSNMQSSTAMGIPDFLRNQRFGMNNYYLGKGEEKFHFPGSGGMYSRPFGI